MKSVPCTSPRVKSVLGLSLALLLPAAGHAATISLTSAGSSSTNAYSAAGQWSSAAAPTAGNDYTSAGFTVRTATGYAGGVFAGDSLTLGDGTGAGSLNDKGTSGSVLTINDLRMNGGTIAVGASTANGTWNVAGNMLLMTGTGGILQANATNTPSSANRALAISSNISGSGPLFIQNGTLTAGNTAVASVTLSGLNTYTGFTNVGTSSTDTGTAEVRLTINTGSTVGSVLNILANGALTLNSETNLVAAQSLVLDNDLATLQRINLNFATTSTIGALSLDGGTTFATPGTYGAIGSTATNQSDYFTGTGTLTVVGVPEPGTVGMMILAGCALVAIRFAASSRTSRKI